MFVTLRPSVLAHLPNVNLNFGSKSTELSLQKMVDPRGEGRRHVGWDSVIAAMKSKQKPTGSDVWYVLNYLDRTNVPDTDADWKEVKAFIQKALKAGVKPNIKKTRE